MHSSRIDVRFHHRVRRGHRDKQVGRIDRDEKGRSSAAPLRGERTDERSAAEIGCATYLVGSSGSGLLLLLHDFVDLQAEAFGYAGAVGGIGFVEMLDLQLLDAARDAA